jgi:cell division protein FtsW
MASSPAAAARYDYNNSFYFLYKHMIFVGLGVFGMFITSLFDAINARRIAVFALIASVLLMIALPFIGYEVKGATRWVRIGPLGLQPSEFAKPAFIVFAAWMFSIRHRDPNVPAVGIVFVVFFVLLGLLISQPDFGQSFLLTLGFAAVFFFAGLSLGWLLIMLGITVVGAIGAYAMLPHVRARVSAFTSPNTADSYQADKALEAISAGGFFGRGPGEGSVKYSLPDMNTDFIFAVTVEEFGFLISTILIILLSAFVVQTFRNALRLNDYFCQLAASGLATLVGMQVIINLYVNLNMAPSKGMTLPFISNGGSSMLALCFTAGLILAFTRRRPGAYEYGR